MKEKPQLSRTIETGSIGDAGISEHIEASADERAAIAAEHNLISVDSLSADLDIRRSAAGLIVVDGVLRAEVVHTCVISLEPAPQSIDEPIHVTLAAAGSKEAPPPPKPGAEIMIDPEIDQPDVIAGPTTDLGRIVLEHFTLALDPYPRAPGAKLPAAASTGAETPAESPFAALSGLAQRKT
ncbi:MAG TPA: DUF177 domain-containing protein [Bauldia sp.]|nr:DUF177 domain-containing protein [Bauldia sp.]